MLNNSQEISIILFNPKEINPNSTYPLSEPSVDCGSKTKEEIFPPPPGFELQPPGAEGQCATNELR